MPKRQVIIIVSGVALLALIAGIGFLTERGTINFPQVGRQALPPEEKTDVQTAKEIAPGSSLVSEKGVVFTPFGEEVRTDVEPNSPLAPRSSLPLSTGDVQELQKSGVGTTVVIKTSLGKFLPASFEVKRGEVVNLVVNAVDRAHIIYFENPALKGVSAGANAGETRSISFPAPNKAGEYVFYCDVPGHRDKGETGKMIVK